VTAITDFVNRLPAADMATNGQAVADFLRTRSEVTSSGVADGGAWAVFKNGLAHVVVLNRGQSDLDDTEFVPGRAAGPRRYEIAHRRDRHGTPDPR